jgi:hypothetical protein
MDALGRGPHDRATRITGLFVIAKQTQEHVAGVTGITFYLMRTPVSAFSLGDELKVTEPAKGTLAVVAQFEDRRHEH